ncbi:hypothetical protein, partial [Amycolatopsis antarctica]
MNSDDAHLIPVRPGQRAALAALAEWWRVRDQLPGERANLVAAAWRTAGIRNVRQLAAAAGV